MLAKNLNNLCLCSLSLILISSCDRHNVDPNPINMYRELLGVWNDGQGCTAKYIDNNNHLTLMEFKNSRGESLHNIQLTYKKDGITSKFKSATVNFKGSYVEGIMLIDTYCTSSLHKIDNN